MLFFLMRGFMPHPPKLIPIDSNIVSELTTELRANYTEVSRIESEIFDSVLKIHILYEGELDELKTQSMLRNITSSIYARKIGESAYKSIAVSTN
jgi:hypothetical protein